MKSFLLFLLIFPIIALGQNHILITEIVVTPTAGEFVEIYNNTGNTIDLSDYYLTDGTYSGNNEYYYNIVTGANAGGESSYDFHVRFPSGSLIAAGEFQTVAMNGANFVTTYGIQPTYEVYSSDASITDMLEVYSGTINSLSGLSNAGEVVVLYYWDGQSDLVQDVEYLVWGDKAEAVAKTGISIDGPDPDTTPSTYLNDTDIALQISASPDAPHTFGESIQRLNLTENSEIQTGGNGITGNDETSEDLATSFQIAAPNPGTGPSSNNSPVISNITQLPAIPSPTDTVFITADITDNGSIVSAKLFTSINSSQFDSTDMTFLSGDTYESIILPQTNGTQIEYYIKAEDNDGQESISSTFNYTVSSGSSPTISNIIHIPGNPTSNDTVSITADVTDNGIIIGVKLFTSIDSAPFDSTNMTFLSGDTYESEIFPQANGTQVEYYIKAEDNDGLTSISANHSYVVSSGTSGGPHLLFTEISVVPTAGEFVEIYNNTNSTIDLSNYYLTDATYATGNSFYYNIVTGSNAGGGDFGDFHAKFPSGVSIAPGEYQTIAMDGSGFVSTYGTQPTYELYDTDAGISDMLEAVSGSINNQGGLTNSGEMAVLYYWDGQSDLVQDIDYAVWGDKAEAVDKSGISIDGPDADAISTSYLNDTPIAQQISVSSADPHSIGETIQRLSFIENNETQTNGNGITGHDETSEDLATSFQTGSPNPGSGPTASNTPVLSNISQQPSLPSPTDSVIISADVTDNGTVVSVKLFKSINSSAFDSTDMNLQSGDTYQGLILPQADGTPVQYYIKAIDNEGLVSASTTFNYVVTTGGGIIPIANIQNNSGYIGQQVIIEGIVTLGAGVTSTSWTSAYVQDSSERGINIYQSGTVDLDLVRKNLLQISGTVEEYGGVTEITNYSVQIIDTNQTLPAPLQLSTLDANDLSYEGTYILSKGIVVDMYSGGGGTTIRIDDGSGPIDFRAWDTAGLILDSYVLGDTVAIKGVMGIYLGNAQISLAYQDEIDFTTLEISGEGSGNVIVSPDSVSVGELLSLEFSITGTSPDTVSVVDITIPQEWNWTGDISDVAVTGVPFNSANISVNGKNINVFDVLLANNSQGSIILNNITAPAVDTVSQFIIKTGDALRVSEIDNLPLILVGAGTQIKTVPISFIQTDSTWIGKTVTVKAVVSIGAGILRTDYTDGYVQDSTGYGLNIFDFDPPDPEVVKGNLLLLTGLIEEYEGITEITNYSFRVLRKNSPIPGIKEITTIAATSRDFEGSYVKVSGTVIDNYSAGGGTNLIMDDGSGEVTLRIWDTAQLDLSSFEIGDGIVAYGVVDLYQDIGQVLIGYQEDIQHIVLPRVPQFIKLPNKPFVPDRGEILVIRYSAGSEDTQTTMRVYDLSGRLVTTLLDGSGRSFEQQIKWNGRDQLNDLVPLGTYILHYEVVNNSTGKKWQKAAPIVVGTVLK